MRFGRHGKDEQAQDSPVVDAVVRARSKRVTGRIDVDLQGAVLARIFLVDGAVYSVQSPVFVPEVGRRLLAAGAVSADQWQALLAAGTPSDAGRIALAEAWVEPRQVNTVHQEFLLALLGALLELPDTSAHVTADAVTAEGCSAPIDVDTALQAVATRRDRLADDWLHVPSTAGPAQTVLGPTGVPLPPALGLPEFTVFLESCDGSRTVDAAAAIGGFTRAEAVHLAAILVSSGCLHVLGRAAGDTGTCLVPEALSAAHLVAHRPEPERGPERGPETVVAMATVVATEDLPEPVVAATASAPAEIEADADGSERADTEPVDDFDIAALAGELAAAEHWAGELRNRLERARARRAASHG